MIRAPFDALSPAGVFALLVLCAVAGTGMGVVYFRSVRASARWLAEGGGGGWLLGLAALRLTLLAVGLLAVTRLGALPLLVAAAGIVMARGIVLRAVEREAP